MVFINNEIHKGFLMKKYLFSYRFDGKPWSTSIYANSPSEAREKIKAVGNATYDGEIMMEVFMPIKKSWFEKVRSVFNRHK